VRRGAGAAACLALTLAPGGSQEAPPTDPLHSVVQVRVSQGLSARQGSGVVVAPGRVVTNAHVIGEGGSVAVLDLGVAFPARIVASDPGRDLCLLEVPGFARPPVRSLPPEQRRTGIRVRAIGYPGHALSISRGTLTGVWQSAQGPLLQTDAPIAPGSSGGGLFNEQGRFLGLTTFASSTARGISFAVAAEALADLRSPGAAAGPVPGPREAFTALVESIAAHPENQPAWEAFVRSWVRLAPQDHEAWYALGCALHLRLEQGAKDRGRQPDAALWDETLAAFRQAAGLGPGMAQAWNNLGFMMEAHNRFDEAEAALGEAVALAPDYALAWSNLGRCRFNARRYPEAAEALRTALRYRPFDAALWRLLGLALCFAGRAEGVAHLEKAVALQPDHADFLADLARQQHRAGDREAARRSLARLKALDPALHAETLKDLPRR
jgi:hypothetical protein